MTPEQQRALARARARMRMAEAGYGVDNSQPVMRGVPPLQDQSPPDPISGVGTAQADMGNILSGFMQGTSPVTRDVYGESIRPPAGPLREIQDDSGLTTYGFDGPQGFVPISRKRGDQSADVGDAAERYVVLSDPATGQPMVYERSRETDETMPVGAGRMMAFGLTGSVPGGARAAAGAAARPSVFADFQRIGVTPNLPAATGSKSLGALGTTIEDIPGVGALARAGSTRVENDLVAAGQRATEGATSPMQAGRTAREGIDAFNTRQPLAQTFPEAPLPPSRAIGFRTKANALYDRIWRGVPADAQIGLPETQQVIADVRASIQNPALADEVISTQMRRFGEILDQSGGQLTTADARAFRTAIREARKKPDLVQNIGEANLARLEAALTEDITQGVSQVAGGEVARALRQADRFYKVGAERLKSLRQITNTTSDTQAFDRLLQAARGRGGKDAALLQQVRKAVGEDSWREIVGTMLDTLGAAKPGQGEGFSPRTFLTEFRKLTPQSKAAMFDTTGQRELRTYLDSYARAVDAWDKSRSMRNFSRTGSFLTAAGGIGLTGSGAVSPLTMVALGSVSGAAGGLLMSPRTVMILNKIERAVQADDIARATRLAAGMDKVIPSSDEMAPAARELQASLMSLLRTAGQTGEETRPPAGAMPTPAR